ncbi:MAG: AbrB/MazE/SpoVT family DNA-binding domain-containing protein [Deltaproteobacteria bacterium]|jgi:antitoxin PrlF|nr:AbrB/MazE/SpoVT family DNA-binding domain-containing protein [Deltaproteobacteria bacterium]MBT4527121.1 AbrB/MazE/SpoVT family DNA-binding domain-containing protein [Deltaproteobacteria bacterium]
MRVTTKGQVTIPRHIREEFGILPESEVEFKVENRRVYIERKLGTENKFKQLRGVATVKMSTEEIMQLTRGDE